MLNLKNLKLANGKIVGVDVSPSWVAKHAEALAGLGKWLANPVPVSSNDWIVDPSSTPNLKGWVAQANIKDILEGLEVETIKLPVEVSAGEADVAIVTEAVRRLRWWLNQA
jgi:hypothetical protein